MTWVIACFCGHLIDTTTCPHCESEMPEFSSPAPAGVSDGLRAVGNDEHVPSVLAGSKAA